MAGTLFIENLHVATDAREILAGISLRVHAQELHILMGPNGSGKSTLAQTIAGNPKFSITSGVLRFGSADLLRKRADERARLGVFVAFQQPLAIPGVSVGNFLRTAFSERNGEHIRPSHMRARIAATFPDVGLPVTTMERELNVGFSGGEQKRMELAQLLLLGAKIAVLDEVDSGLDIDGLQQVVRAVERLVQNGAGVILITHNPRIVGYFQPTAIHVIDNGVVAASGGKALGERIAAQGYGALRA